MFRFFRQKMKAILITIAVIFAATMFYGIGYVGIQNMSGQGKKEGLAKVNGKEVDAFRFNQIMNGLAREQKGGLDPMTLLYLQNLALQQLIDFTLVVQEGSRMVSAGGQEVSDAVKQIMAANKITDEKTFNAILKPQGFSVDNLKKMIKEEIIYQKTMTKIKGEVTVTPDDLREVRAQHILLKTMGVSKEAAEDAKKKAEAVLKLAKEGKDFGWLAKKWSDDEQTAKKGGDLGFLKKGATVKEFDQSVFSLKPGEISGIVKTMYGYHIIKMNESRTIKNANKDKILGEKRENAFASWFADIKSKAKIEIENHILNAFSMRLQGDLKGAAAEYGRAIKSKPSNPYPHIFLAEIKSQEGDKKGAMEEFSAASSLAGADPFVHLYIGKVYLEAAKTSSGATSESYNSRARDEFQKASVISGDNKQAHETLAQFFKQLKLTKLYREELAKIAVIDSKQKLEEKLRREGERKK